MSTPEHVLWLDLEATTTDAHSDIAAVLEIGAIITDYTPELNEVARASLVVRPPGLQSDHDRMWAQMDPFVRDMHTANGLWAEATTGDDAWQLAEADPAFANWISETVGGVTVPMAGSGVAHFDHPYVRVHLPATATRLTYWMLDIGQIRRMLDLANRRDLVHLEQDVDAKPHRGLADVELHVAEARRYLALLGRIPVDD
jgi:oligoribonuclease